MRHARIRVTPRRVRTIRRYSLIFTSATIVAIISVTGGTETAASAASASSPGYTTVNSTCDGTPIQVILPVAGQGLPASLLGGVPASAAAQLESTSINWVTPTCSQETGLVDGADDESAASSEPYLGLYQSYNWSGYLVFPASGSGNTYNTVEAQWDVPSVTSSTGDDQYTASWVGLGSGVGETSGVSNLLDQAGTFQTVVNGAASYQFYWQLFPENDAQKTEPNGVALPAISPGNAVEALVDHTSTYATEILLENLTTDQATAFTVTWGTNYTELGDQAEWIMERPTINGQFPQLADFDTFTFHNMYIVNENNDTYYPGELTREQMYMTNCTQTETLAQPNDLVNGTAADNTGTIDWDMSGTGGDGTC